MKVNVNEGDKFELNKRDGSSMSYQTPNVQSDWPFGAAGLPNSPLSLLRADSSTQIGASGASASMGEPLGPNPWGHPSNAPSLGYCGINVQNGGNTSDVIGIRKSSFSSLGGNTDRPFDMVWNTSSSLLKEGIMLPNAPGMLSHCFSQFPVDSAFIERAARFSSFSGGDFNDTMSPFGMPERMALYSHTGGVMQGAQDKGLRSATLSQKNELNASRMGNETSLRIENEPTEASPLRSEKKSESLGRSNEEARQGVRDGSCNESDEAESSRGTHQEDTTAVECTSGEPSAKDAHLKKRKRNATDSLLGQVKRNQQSAEAVCGNADNQQKSDQNLTTTAKKAAEKQSKQGSQTSDPPKEDYIHVRARRGQATNSHSLAERVRREKISERMKFLQDLVPGCSKVTGKAVMLDEIINYVQSLQRQVEFLSMKLATVNPRLDFNVDGFMAKDIVQSRIGPSSVMGFSPNMPIGYSAIHQPLHGLVQGSLSLMGNPSDVLRRTMRAQLMPLSGGFSEPSQPSNTWDDELHSAIQANYGTSGPDSQDANGSLLQSHLKAEL